MRNARTQTGRTIATPSTSWMPRWRMPPVAKSVDFTCPPITSNSRLSSHAPATAVTMLVSPGPAVTSANALPEPPTSLKYSVAIPAATSCTTGMHDRVRSASSRCMMLPPATKKQCV